jgi:hypothetical protein
MRGGPVAALKRVGGLALLLWLLAIFFHSVFENRPTSIPLPKCCEVTGQYDGTGTWESDYDCDGCPKPKPRR